MLGPFRRHGRRRAAIACALLTLFAAAPAAALMRVPAKLSASGNPANPLADLPIERTTYDRATRCSKAARPGMTALVTWLERHVRGTSWGTYRCEKWGRGSTSLHAEGRALDWALDRSDPADAREAERLILLLLAPDRTGNTQALARRMGVQEVIWDCGYWAAGMTSFKKYGPCYSKSGRARKHVDVTIAHRNHIHIGLTKAGAARKTSFWTRRAPRPQDQATPIPVRGDGGVGSEDDDRWDEVTPDDAAADPGDDVAPDLGDDADDILDPFDDVAGDGSESDGF